MNDLNWEVLHPRIHVYRNLIKDPESLVEILKESELNPGSSKVFTEWIPWSIFGTYLNQTPLPEYLMGSVSPDQRDDKFYNHYEHAENILNAFHISTDHFLSVYDEKKGDDWVIMGPSYSRYFNDNDPHSSENVMMHHTDFVRIEEDMPGNKFVLTCTMYLNDDYDGGDLDFIVNDYQFTYKPKMGDVMVFPSSHPNLLSEGNMYLHAVKKVEKVDKYLIRCFYQVPYQGSAGWLKNQERYGEEVWAEMERKRIEEGRRY
jgi:hypothetical protein